MNFIERTVVAPAEVFNDKVHSEEHKPPAGYKFFRQRATLEIKDVESYFGTVIVFKEVI